MKQLIISGGLLAGDVLAEISSFASRPEAAEIHYGLLAMGLLGLLFSFVRFGRATAVALIECCETYTP
jgi:hypothetical protein